MSDRNPMDSGAEAQVVSAASPTGRDADGGTLSLSALPFFILVFVLAVPFWIVGMIVDVQPMPGLHVAAAMFVVPALTALILVYRERRAAGVDALLCRSFDGGQIPKRWYLPIVLIMPLVTAASFALLRWSGVAVPAPHLEVVPTIGLLVLFMVGALGEELGWTGYVLDRLQAQLGTLQSALLLGGVWAIWHWIALAQAHRSPAWIAWWSLGAVSARIIMVWLYNQTGRSVFGIVALHAISNTCWQSFPVRGSFFDPRVNSVVLSLVALTAIVITRGTLCGHRRSAMASGRNA
jgi:membrane protease YdiL (CAAX protease family)